MKGHGEYGRCKSKVAYGSVWDAGRRRCSKNAIGEEGVCGTHLRVLRRREERNKK